MVNTSVMRPSGRTYALNLTTSASAALEIAATTNDQTNYVSLLNTGTGVAAVEFVQFQHSNHPNCGIHRQ
jgi:hypothetical protein